MLSATVTTPKGRSSEAGNREWSTAAERTSRQEKEASPRQVDLGRQRQASRWLVAKTRGVLHHTRWLVACHELMMTSRVNNMLQHDTDAPTTQSTSLQHEHANNDPDNTFNTTHQLGMMTTNKVVITVDGTSRYVVLSCSASTCVHHQCSSSVYSVVQRQVSEHEREHDS